MLGTVEDGSHVSPQGNLQRYEPQSLRFPASQNYLSQLKHLFQPVVGGLRLERQGDNARAGPANHPSAALLPLCSSSLFSCFLHLGSEYQRRHGMCPGLPQLFQQHLQPLARCTHCLGTAQSGIIRRPSDPLTLTPSHSASLEQLGYLWKPGTKADSARSGI